ncbi:MAG: 4Fe-4S binding protein [bacterium]|nr:MAG: 4Fe-4S binding protein [bacterium]
MDDLKHSLKNHLRSAGYKIEIVSIHRLRDLRSEMGTLISNNDISKEFCDEKLSDFCFQIPEVLPAAKSIIITAIPQLKVTVEFSLNGVKIPVVIPPTYSSETDGEFFEIISAFLAQHGYSVCNAFLPAKALAVHAGLAFYGRNNIAYTNDWGSYFKLKAFYTDMPCFSDNWQEFSVADRCKKCKSCINHCPTQAISQDRFLIKHERCLTYLNESINDFPEWVDPNWHHCLIGCMVCQDVCPLNQDLKDQSKAGCEFTEAETRQILRSLAKDKLSGNIVTKLKRLDIFDEYIAIQRNLKAVISKFGSISPHEKQQLVN